MSESHHPTLSMTIPVYNYLIDVIEKFIDGDKSDEEFSTSTINNRKENHQTTLNKDIVLAAENAKAKLLKYYPTSDGRVFIISMSMY
jgi:hypothetical protein